MSPYRRALFAVLALAFLACAYVGVVRYRQEHASRHVEITMDFSDFDVFARSYGYNEEQFLIALRRAGLTSLAIGEELGSAVGSNSANAISLSGPAVLNQARIGTLSEPTLSRLVREGKILATDVYLVVYNDQTYKRYRRDLPTRFGTFAVRVLNPTKPYVIAIRTQSDYFANVGLGIPDEQLALARKLHLTVDPRFQNDERYGAPQIDQIVGSVQHRAKIGTTIFMGLSSQVLGYPDHLKDTAAAFKRDDMRFGAIEWYDKNQDQKGSEDLATLIPGRTTRVQAISRPELDRLDPRTEVGRYLLGVRERNVRVVYLRPFAHLWDRRSPEATNVEIVRRIAAGLRSRGYTLGTATPIPAFRVNPAVIAVASLAVPAIFLLILAVLGIARRRIAFALFALDLIVVAVAYLFHHDLVARKLIALSGGILLPIAAALAIAPAFRHRIGGNPYIAGLRALVVGVAVAALGGLIVVGLLSTPLMMEEIDRFSGVKAVLVIPPLAILALYWFTPIFGGQLREPRRALDSPVKIFQLIGLAVLGVGGILLVMRSGNTSDLTPSNVELALRSNLTAILSVRPRFKEFLIGYPFLMLLPSLVPADRRNWGWLFALAIGVGLSDVVDTFSHLHTPLSVSIIRVVLGVVIGAVIGTAAIALYRLLRLRTA